MKLFRLSLRRKRRRLPVWATERTTEKNVLRREAEAVIAENHSRTWAQANTGLLTVIRTELQRLETANAEHDCMSWCVVSGEAVTVGDVVVVLTGADNEYERHPGIFSVPGGFKAPCSSPP